MSINTSTSRHLLLLAVLAAAMPVPATPQRFDLSSLSLRAAAEAQAAAGTNGFFNCPEKERSNFEPI